MRTRKFNGETYSSGGFTPSKQTATDTAKKLRKLGAKARIIKMKGGYQVWGRKD